MYVVTGPWCVLVLTWLLQHSEGGFDATRGVRLGNVLTSMKLLAETGVWKVSVQIIAQVQSLSLSCIVSHCPVSSLIVPYLLLQPLLSSYKPFASLICRSLLL